LLIPIYDENSLSSVVLQLENIAEWWDNQFLSTVLRVLENPYKSRKAASFSK
jgi:hypothetical protein